MTERTLGRAAVAGGGATAMWQLIRLVILGLSIVLLARLLDPSDFGLVAMVTALIGVGELIRDLGLSMAAVQAASLSSAEKSNLFWVNTGIGALLTTVVFCLADPIAAVYDQPELAEITRILSFTFVINGVATQFKAQINRDLRFMALGASEAVPQALGLICAVAWAMTVGGYFALVIQGLVMVVSGLVMTVCLAGWRPGWFDRRTSIRPFMRFGGALLGTQSLAYISKNLDTVALGLTVSPAQLGLYNRGYQIVVLPITQLTAPMSRVAIPVLARTSDDETRFMKYLRMGQFFSVLVASVVYGLLVGLAGSLLLVVLGPEWVAATHIVQILAVSAIFRVMGQVPYWLFVSRGEAGSQFRFYLVAQPVIFVGIIVGLPFGPIGVATGLTVGYALFWVLQMWWASRVVGVAGLRLALAAFTIVLTFAVPIAAIGVLATELMGRGPGSLLVGFPLVGAYAVLVMAVVPAFRGHLATARGALRVRGVRP